MTTPGLSLTDHRPRVPYSIVVVSFAHDQPFLDLQARSFQLYLGKDPHLVERIVYVDNFDTATLDRASLSAHLGRLSSRTTFLSARDFPVLPPSGGWMRQQALKLLVARTVETPRYILLDAKNHLVGPLTRDFVETPDGGLMRGRTVGYRNLSLRPYVAKAIDYFRLDPRMIDSFMASTTPFPISTGLARSLLAYVEGREQQAFGRWFCGRERAAGVSEFGLYAAFLAFVDGGFTRLYDLANPGPPTLWKGNVGQFDRVLQEACRQPFIGVHRAAFRRLDSRQRRGLARFWTERRLFDSEALAQAFIDECAEFYT